MNEIVKIIIGADIVPTQGNEKFFSSGEIDKIIDLSLISELQSADYIALNLECPLINNGEKIKKAGPNLKAQENTICGLRLINPYFFTLANNHIMDYGEEGLRKTCDILNKNNIQYGGVGDNLNEIKKYHIASVKRKKIGFYCCVENEFSYATDKGAGANPYDPLSSFDDVKELKKKCDIVIVLYHGGKEHYRFPSPNLRKVFRKFADYGADLVIAQHTHCIGCKEDYNNAVLIYGQGNFVFDDEDDEYWNSSLLVQMEIDINNKIVYRFIPCVKKEHYIEMATNSEANRIIDDFIYRSCKILDDAYVNKKFDELLEREKTEYFYRLSGGFGKLLSVRLLNKLSNYAFLKRMYKNDNKYIVRNCIECESHREVIINMLKE